MIQGGEAGREGISKRIRKFEIISSYYLVLLWVIWMDLEIQVTQYLLNKGVTERCIRVEYRGSSADKVLPIKHEDLTVDPQCP